MTTFVLLHGGGHGGWCYQKVARILLMITEPDAVAGGLLEFATCSSSS